MICGNLADCIAKWETGVGREYVAGVGEMDVLLSYLGRREGEFLQGSGRQMVVVSRWFLYVPSGEAGEPEGRGLFSPC